ncbi:hypothetical protein D9613_010092 [Agrocybe pediades]|uniref:DUF6533 domain-containing protein n=1 Tax=Agrocybe pediades TaxID=84607 RepID=A0A8H4VQR2_9AGAR|nr:hypothetical protein D9613_010092 [Agrocybe pediades]
MDRSALIEAVFVMRLFSYVWVSATVFLLCDNLSTLDLEMTHVWRSKWSIPKVVYFLLRYYGFFTMALRHGTALGDGKHPRLLPLEISYDEEYITGLRFYVGVTVGLDAARTIFIAPTGLPLPGCLSNPDPKLNIPALAYYTSRQLGMPFRFSPVMKALVRDGIAFFLLRWYNAAYISIGCRLILNIRKVAHTHGEALARGDSFVFGGLETSLTIGREFHGNTDVQHDENNC